LKISSTLCTLQKVVFTTQEDGNVVTSTKPVARSYSSNGWEVAPGSYAPGVLSLKDDDFVDSGEHTFLTLPAIDSNSQDYYVLTLQSDGTSSSAAETSSRRKLNEQKDQNARFLEMTTFGTTKQDLNLLTAMSPEEWLENQMNDVEPTSHRAYWRQRSHPRWLFSQKVGRSDHPCDPNSKWRRFTFTRKDRYRRSTYPGGYVYVKPLGDPILMNVTEFDLETDEEYVVEKTVGTGPYMLFVDGYPRTVVQELDWRSTFYKDRFPTWDPDHPYQICRDPYEFTTTSSGQSRLYIRTKRFLNSNGDSQDSCQEIDRNIGNPPINFTEYEIDLGPNVFEVSENTLLEPIEEHTYNYNDVVDRRVLVDGLSSAAFPICETLPEQAEDFAAPIWIKHPVHGLLQWDPRLVLESNTPDSPIQDGGGLVELSTGSATSCMTAPRTFLNDESCKLSTEPTAIACSQSPVPPQEIVLNETNIFALHELTGRYSYQMRGLQVSIDKYEIEHVCGSRLRSRWTFTDGACATPTTLQTTTRDTLYSLLRRSDSNPYVKDITMGSSPSCMENNDPVEIDIEVEGKCYTRVHPEYYSVWDLTYWVNRHPGGKLAIKKWLDGGLHYLTFPSENVDNPHPMFRWDNNNDNFQYVGRFGDSVAFRDLPPALRLLSVADFFGISPSESGYGVVVCGSPGEVATDKTMDSSFDLSSRSSRDTTSTSELQRQREVVWTMVALYSQDQLRQRMAWALSQILVVAKGAIAGFDRHTESFLAYYDIFVRNAFGNYLDVLREISYSPMMAENLSFLDSKSTAYVWERFNRKEWADENFAREIMQLFSIGLVKLNIDGTPDLDENGNVVQVYTNSDIRSFARAWTGFTAQSKRGNVEDYDNTHNRVDPMRIEADWRDRFPKSDLYGGYVGDGYPLCADLPPRQYLRKGSKYKLLGGSKLPTLMTDGTYDDQQLFILDSTLSQLYPLLCKDEGNGCTHPLEVTLDSNLGLDIQEIEVDEVRVVEVTPGLYYEYVRPPCVEHAFYDNALKLDNSRSTLSVCANPLLAVASSACCDSGSTKAAPINRYDVERMTFATQNERCQSAGKTSCDFTSYDNWKDSDVYYWTNAECSISVKIDPEGEVTIVHSSSVGDMAKHVRDDNFNYFSVKWEGGQSNYPKAAEGSCGACDIEQIEGQDCLCAATIVETPVFTSLPSSDQDILSQAHIGAPDPASFDSNLYTNSEYGTGFIAHHRTSSDAYSTHTIFEILDSTSSVKFLKNAISMVQVNNGQSSFRNPVTFLSMVPAELTARDAAYETEAALEHYFFHDNTAPFLCTRFIQRFGISNASPRYVKTCAEAFQTGEYQTGTRSFGSGMYGDLSATVAAIVLDREARENVLDTDPTYGSIREPLMRVIAFMRSMEHQPFEGEKPMVIFDDINELIGQMAHEHETVFSYFLPEYQPPGLVSQASLVAPEAMLLDMPKNIGILNGLHGLISYGLSACPSAGYGFGFYVNSGGCRDGQYNRATGSLTYAPAENATSLEVVDELATLLTAGKLSEESRQIVSEVYASETDASVGLRKAQKLIVTSPEFHTNTVIKPSGESRPPPPPPQTGNGEYKAIVFLMLSGGCDSYQMLVPKTCVSPGGEALDAYAHYAETRTPVHLNDTELLPIDGSGQVNCSEFGLHPNLPILQELYNAGDLTFFANTGVLHRPADKYNYRDGMPAQLFAHNAMQQETKMIDLFEENAGTGVLGRISDKLTLSGTETAAISVDSQSITLQGSQGVSPAVTIVSSSGTRTLRDDEVITPLKSLNNGTSFNSNFFAETFSESLLASVDGAELLSTTLASATVHNDGDFGSTRLGRNLKIVARMMQTRQARGVDVDVYYVEVGGYDTHSRVGPSLVSRFTEVNEGMSAFVAELKNKTLWDSVTIVQASEFARTLNPNSNVGTDHAWGGNYFMAGGSVKGRQILGQFPRDMSTASDIGLSRGRLVPTTAWDQVWNGIAQHHGITSVEDLDYVCPNRQNFADKLFTASDLYKAETPPSPVRRKYLRR